MVTAAGVRIGWSNLPARVRSAVESILGAAVVSAVSQPGGFSPGSADRIRLADGRRAFVKAVSSAQNPHSPGIHRREARVAAALPASVPAPRLLGCYDDGEWVALVLADVEGRHPRTPWLTSELDLVLAMLARLGAVPVPAALADLPTVAEQLAFDFAGWERIAADPPPRLDPWVARHLDGLRELADRALTALSGQSLVHVDIRADNLLLGADGTVTLVDWPWASRGPAWLDTLTLLINVRLYGGHDTEALLARCPVARGVAPVDVTAVLAGWAAFFTDITRQPPPPGLPTVRAFQRAQAEAVISWLRERLDESGDGGFHVPTGGRAGGGVSGEAP